MAKSKLKYALDKQKGRDYKLEKQLKQQKEAEKKKKARQPEEDIEEEENSAEEHFDGAESDASEEVDGGVKLNGKGQAEPEDEDDEEDWEDEEDEEDAPAFDLSRLDDSESSSDSEIDQDAQEDADAEDIPLSDIESLASDDKADIVPHQRLTINNTSALLRSLKSFALPTSRLPFSEHQSMTSDEPVEIADIEDDLQRELAFYEQALSAAKEGRELLKKEGVPFSRPPDYFAEMVKSDEHMGRVKQKLVDQAAGKRAAQDAKRQRELKKFGKQVQIAKLQERDKQKRETLDRIKVLKRKRASGSDLQAPDEDLFDVALEDAAVTQAKDKAARQASGPARGKPNSKRQKKDAKFGFGGKKRFAKSGDAMSSADMRGFSTKKMKGGAGAAKQRPGKSRRVKNF